MADRPELGLGASPSPVSPGSLVIKRPDQAVKLSAEVVERVRAAVRWLNLHGDPDATLKDLLMRVALEEVRRLEVKLNNGEPFGDARALPRRGRIQPEETDPCDAGPAELSYDQDSEVLDAGSPDQAPTYYGGCWFPRLRAAP